MDLSRFKNKKIAVLGYGREGRALVRFFQCEGIGVTVLDKDPLTLNPSPARGEGKVVAGNKYLKNLDKFDIIFRSPGIPRLTPELIAAEKKGVKISSLTKLFFDLCPGKIIGVTGTKGKGTTAILIYNILKAAAKDVFLGGNIGTPALDFLKDLKKDSFAILELSSFQLQDLDKSPPVAVVLDISSDHLDHHRTREEYVEAKRNILKYQKDDDLAILDGDSNTVKKIAENTKSKKYWFGKSDKILGVNFTSLNLIGEHNIKNAKAAAIVAQALGVKNEIIQEALNKTMPRKHRLEFVKEHNGVKYFNDSAATIPESAIAAIRSFKEPKILIMGGSDKGADYADLTRVVAKSNVKAVVLIGETGKRIQKALREAEFTGMIAEIAGSRERPLLDAVAKAKTIAEKGDVVLLSSASASFGLFDNFEDRGEKFRDAVLGL